MCDNNYVYKILEHLSPLFPRSAMILPSISTNKQLLLIFVIYRINLVGTKYYGLLTKIESSTERDRLVFKFMYWIEIYIINIDISSKITTDFIATILNTLGK